MDQKEYSPQSNPTTATAPRYRPAVAKAYKAMCAGRVSQCNYKIFLNLFNSPQRRCAASQPAINIIWYGFAGIRVKLSRIVRRFYHRVVNSAPGMEKGPTISVISPAYFSHCKSARPGAAVRATDRSISHRKQHAYPAKAPDLMTFGCICRQKPQKHGANTDFYGKKAFRARILTIATSTIKPPLSVGLGPV